MAYRTIVSIVLGVAIAATAMLAAGLAPVASFGTDDGVEGMPASENKHDDVSAHLAAGSSGDHWAFGLVPLSNSHLEQKDGDDYYGANSWLFLLISVSLPVLLVVSKEPTRPKGVAGSVLERPG